MVFLRLTTTPPPPTDHRPLTTDHRPLTTDHQVVLKELRVHDFETTQFNFFCNILITEFAAMRSKTAEDMELIRKYATNVSKQAVSK